MTRRRDIILASPYATELATRQVFGPVLDALDQPVQSMGDVRKLKALTKDIHTILDDHMPDSPGKSWRAARRTELNSYDTAHAWKCRVLKLNLATTPTLALGGMTPMDVDGWKLAIAVPAPNPMTIEVTPIDKIVLIDPKTGQASLYKDKGSHLIEPANVQRFTVHTDANAWARDFARARLEHVRTAQQARRIANIPPVWIGLPPSALAIGKLNLIDWPASDFITAGEGVEAKALARVVRKPSARVHAPMTLRSAA